MPAHMATGRHWILKPSTGLPACATINKLYVYAQSTQNSSTPFTSSLFLMPWNTIQEISIFGGEDASYISSSYYHIQGYDGALFCMDPCRPPFFVAVVEKQSSAYSKSLSKIFRLSWKNNGTSFSFEMIRKYPNILRKEGYFSDVKKLAWIMDI